VGSEVLMMVTVESTVFEDVMAVYPEDGSSRVFQNVGSFLSGYSASHLRRKYFS
jgi:hypothetical protein